VAICRDRRAKLLRWTLKVEVALKSGYTGNDKHNHQQHSNYA
jgi:hypothetical protein